MCVVAALHSGVPAATNNLSHIWLHYSTPRANHSRIASTRNLTKQCFQRAPHEVGHRLPLLQLIRVAHAEHEQDGHVVGVRGEGAREGGDRPPVVVVLRVRRAQQAPRLRVAYAAAEMSTSLDCQRQR